MNRALKKSKGICYDCHNEAVIGKSRCTKHLLGNKKAVSLSSIKPESKLKFQQRNIKYKPKNAVKRRELRRNKERFIYVKAHAITKGNIWNLTSTEYVNLIQMPCYKCGNKNDIEAGVGLKKVDSKLGYISGNVESVCTSCLRKRSDTSTFITKAKSIHEQRYDYSKSIYLTNQIPIIIICKIHGEFNQIPHSHLKGHGCSLCGANRIYSNSAMAKKIFGYLYLVRMYNKTRGFFENRNYIGNNKKTFLLNCL